MVHAQLRSTWEPDPPPRKGAKLSIATRLIGRRGRISSIDATGMLLFVYDVRSASYTI